VFPRDAADGRLCRDGNLRSWGPPRQGDAYSSLDKQVERFAELSGPAIVVFQDLDSPPVAATFGKIMYTTYQSFGAV